MTMTAQHMTNEEGTHIIQLTPSFWSLVLSVAIALVTITVTIVTRPSEEKVQQMIELNVRPLYDGMNQMNASQTSRLDRIENKLDRIIRNGGE